MGNHQIVTELGTISFDIDAIRSLVRGTISEYFASNKKSANGSSDITLLEANGTQISESKQGGIDVDVYIDMLYGAQLPEIIPDLRETIHNNILAFADLNVQGINIHVEKIRVPERYQT